MRFFVPILLGVFLPLTVHAAAVSPWVESVLGKVQLGIQTAASISNASLTDDMYATLKDKTLSDLRALIDTHHEVSRFSEEYLFSRTSCYDADIVAIDRMLVLLREKIILAMQERKGASVGVLKSTLSFLNDARRSLILGGLTPGYDDQLLAYIYPFENIDQWKSGVRERMSSPQGPLCPFTTDYLPHQVLMGKSYGCDLSVLTNLSPSSDSEAGLFKIFLTDAKIFIDQISSLTRNFSDTFARSIANIRGSTVTPTPITYIANPPHEAIRGCVRPEVPLGGGDLPSLIDAIDFTTDDSPYTLPANVLPNSLFLQPLHDSFGVSVNDVRLMDLYQRVKLLQGRRRDISDILGLQEVVTFFERATLNTLTPKFQNLSGNLSQEEGYLDLLGRDSPSRLNAANSLMTQAVGRMAVAADDVMPTYVRDLAYFLRRQCVDGPCSPRLEAVLQRILNPYCHPYTSGKYADPKTVEYCYCQDPQMPGFDRFCSRSFDDSQYEDSSATFEPASCVLPQRRPSIEEFLEQRGIPRD